MQSTACVAFVATLALIVALKFKLRVSPTLTVALALMVARVALALRRVTIPLRRFARALRVSLALTEPEPSKMIVDE